MENSYDNKDNFIDSMIEIKIYFQNKLFELKLPYKDQKSDWLYN